MVMGARVYEGREYQCPLQIVTKSAVEFQATSKGGGYEKCELVALVGQSTKETYGER